MSKITKQGVRDLNHLKGKSRGIRLEEPPIVIMCKHRHKVEKNFGGHLEVHCAECNEQLS
jgi:hypothetical protein